jgi:voltage-gated potassium channel Kch
MNDTDSDGGGATTGSHDGEAGPRGGERGAAETVDAGTGDRAAPHVVVVGGGQAGRLLARRLSDGRPVHYVDDDPTAVERAARRHESTYVRDLTDRSTLVGLLAGASHVVVATPRDATNLLVAQHCRAAGVARVVVVVADPRNHDAYPPGVTRICAATTLTDAVVAAFGDDTAAGRA